MLFTAFLVEERGISICFNPASWSVVIRRCRFIDVGDVGYDGVMCMRVSCVVELGSEHGHLKPNDQSRANTEPGVVSTNCTRTHWQHTADRCGMLRMDGNAYNVVFEESWH